MFSCYSSFKVGSYRAVPLASLCFVITFDPFLNIFDRILVQKNLGIVRACAGDVGCAIASVESLRPVASVFKLAKLLAGLNIKLKKCAIVPADDWLPSLAVKFKEWIRTHIPGWSDIAIVPSAKYLGMFIGTVTGT